jgi:hypothetical protein
MLFKMIRKLLIFTILISAISGQQIDRLCSYSKFEDECNKFHRGNSEVRCVRVQDSVECAQRLINNTADFGVISAESAYHLATVGLDVTVIKELRHVDRSHELYDFQSVVVVPKVYPGGLQNLRSMQYCHPGLHFDRHQRWSERFLKHFDRKVVPYNCSRDGKNPAEIEASALSNFYVSACRPGQWSQSQTEDEMLKQKYFNLCSLCDHPSNCSYADSTQSSHRQALECLRRSEDSVTYVALKEAQDFFAINPSLTNDYAFLCPNGSLDLVTNEKPCVWLTQPWKLIITRSELSVSLKTKLTNWMRAGPNSWEATLRDILTVDSYQITDVTNIVSLRDYINPIRSIPAPSPMCQTTSVWCTTSEDEKTKCDYVAAAALTTGILPVLECSEPRSSTVSCLNDISSGAVDFMGIDSTYGYTARYVYNLTTALYAETETEKYSSVVVVVKANSTFQTLNDLKNAKACFPEFGSIASIAFMNAGKQHKIFRDKNCAMQKVLSTFFSESCMPGSRDAFYDPFITNPESLCELCKTNLIPYKETIDASSEGSSEIEGRDTKIIRPSNDMINCFADTTNRFYGNRGALACLNEVGDVAVVELQKLKEHAKYHRLNPDDFVIICRNNTRASNTGFDIDSDCPLTTIIDGEIVVKRNSSRTTGIVNALSSLDSYLQIDPDFKMYNIFTGIKDLLFEDSSVGLVSPSSNELSPSVQNYINLFKNVETCFGDGGSAGSVTANLILTLSLVLITFIVRN